MKRIGMLLLALAFCFASCAASGGEEDAVFAASAHVFCGGGYVFSADEYARISYQRGDGEKMPLCLDPLCTHFGQDCPSFLNWGRPQIAVREGKAPIVFFSDIWVSREDQSCDGRLYRFDFETGERKTLVEGKFERIHRFCLFGRDVYFSVPHMEEVNGERTPAGTEIWKVGTDGSGLTKLCESESSVTFAAISERNKTRSILVTAVLGGAEPRLCVTEDEFETLTPLGPDSPAYGVFASDGYLYYARPSGKVLPAMTVPAHPLDKTHDFTDDGAAIIRGETPLYEYVRVPLDDPGQTPEVTTWGVMRPTSADQPLLVVGDRMYVIPCEPEYLETIAASSKGVLTGGIADDLGETRTEVDYIVTQSGGRILEMTLDGELIREIPTPGFDPRRLNTSDGERLFVSGYVTDGERIRERLDQYGVRSASFLIDEDIVVPIS
ncbi:MAG: hypothetical protein IKQ92_09695 [Clostridia bacterium]|nr:hypothetical protein [Clostridia bacterium]